MEITITRMQATLNNVRYIDRPEHHNYHHVNCSFQANIAAFGLELVLFANTSGTYNNNPNFPSNDLVVDEMKTSRLITAHSQIKIAAGKRKAPKISWS